MAFPIALTCSVASARARGRPSRRCGVERCRQFLFREFRSDRANAGAAAGAVGGAGDGAGRAELRYGAVADTMAQTSARQGRVDLILLSRAREVRTEPALPPRRALWPIPFSRIADPAGGTAGAPGGDVAGRAAARYGDIADTMAQAAARQRYLLAGAADDITTPEQVLDAAKYLGTPKHRIIQTVPGGHIGLFMGARTLKEHWPLIARWIAAQ